MRILVRRTGALGDVILATPIVRRLRRENPDAHIVVQTAYPFVFFDSVRELILEAPSNDTAGYDRVIDLDLAYERRPTMHIVEAYMEEAFGDPGHPGDRRQELFLGSRKTFFMGRRYIVVHAARAGWANRTLPRSTWYSVCRMLLAEGFWPILVGTERDALPGLDISYFQSTDLHATARLIGSCDCFVGSDSALLHVAGATDVPIVGVFTCALPEYRLPWRGGKLGRDCEAVLPELACAGCLVRRTPPVTTEWCERGDIACIEAVTPEMIVDAVIRLTAKNRAATVD